MSSRPVTTVLLEALFIGLMLQVLVMSLTKFIYKGTGCVNYFGCVNTFTVRVFAFR